MSTELIQGLVKRASGLAELNHAGLQVVQGSLDETVLLFVMRQKVVPERVLEKVLAR